MPRRTAAEAEQTRRTIVDSARRAFADDGFAAASTTAIAAAAGVTRGALYHHFADKTALFETVFVELTHELDERVNAAAGDAPDLRSAIEAGTTAYIEFMTRPEYRQIAVADGPAVLGLERWHEIDRSVGLATLQAGLQALHDEGTLGVDPTPAITLAVFGAVTELGLSCARGDLGIGDAARAITVLFDRLGSAGR